MTQQAFCHHHQHTQVPSDNSALRSANQHTNCHRHCCPQQILPWQLLLMSLNQLILLPLPKQTHHFITTPPVPVTFNLEFWTKCSNVFHVKASTGSESTDTTVPKSSGREHNAVQCNHFCPLRMPFQHPFCGLSSLSSITAEQWVGALLMRPPAARPWMQRKKHYEFLEDLLWKYQVLLTDYVRWCTLPYRLMKWYICVSKGQRAIRHVSIHVVGCAPCPHPCLQTGVGAGGAPYFFPGNFKILTVHYQQMTNFLPPTKVGG